MEHFYIIINCRGHHWKSDRIYNATEIFLQKKPFVLMNKNVFFNTEER